MKDMKKPVWKWKIAAAAAAGIIILLSVIRLAKLREKSPASDLNRYNYRDTRHLVSLTGRAAALVAKEVNDGRLPGGSLVNQSEDTFFRKESRPGSIRIRS